MRLDQGTQYLPQNVNHPRRRLRPGMNHQIFERDPVEVLHRIVKDAVRRAPEIEDGDGVGVSEAAGVLHLLFEAAYRMLARAFFGQEFDRRGTPQKGVLSEVDDPHPAFADAFYRRCTAQSRAPRAPSVANHE